jgi:hypothetical protein
VFTCIGYSYSLGGIPGVVTDAAGVSHLSDTYTDAFNFNGVDPTGTAASMLIYVSGVFRSYVDFATGRLGQPFCYTAQGYANSFTGNFTNGNVYL